MEKIILVHTGTKFPNYINDCIFQLKKYNIDIHLIISDHLIDDVSFKNIHIVPETKVTNKKYLNYSLLCSNPNFRDNFLQRASSRFFLIEEYVKQNRIENFFHIENDILLFSDLKNINSILQKSVYNFSFVIDSANRCVPSICWFRNEIEISSLCEFLIKNNNKDDMKNLFEYFCGKKKNGTNFPILSKKSICLLNSITDIDYSNMYDEFNCIFDGAAIGQYIGGIDPRNVAQGIKTKGFVNESTIFDVSKADYIFEEDQPFMIFKNEKIKIANLHIHSKNLKEFIK